MKPRSTSVWTSSHAHAVADVEPFEAAHDLAFDRRAAQMRTHVPLSDAPVTMRVEALADARCEQQRRGGLAHLPLDLGGVVFLLGAVHGQRRQLVVRVRRAARPASAAFSRRWVTRSGKRRFGAVECV